MEDVRRGGIGVDELLDVVTGKWKLRRRRCAPARVPKKFACRANSVDLGYTCTRNREMKRENVGPTVESRAGRNRSGLFTLDTSGPRTGARVEVCEEISRPDLRAQSEALKPSCARNGNLCDDWTLSLGAPGGVAGHTTHPRPPAPRRAPLNFPRPGGCGRSVTT